MRSFVILIVVMINRFRYEDKVALTRQFPPRSAPSLSPARRCAADYPPRFGHVFWKKPKLLNTRYKNGIGGRGGSPGRRLSINSAGKYTFICEVIYCVGPLVTLRQEKRRNEMIPPETQKPSCTTYLLARCQPLRCLLSVIVGRIKTKTCVWHHLWLIPSGGSFNQGGGKDETKDNLQ